MKSIKYLSLIILFATTCFLLGFSSKSILEQNTNLPSDTFENFEADTLLHQLKESGEFWLPFLKRPTLVTGMYRIPAGADDPQSPHKMDEVYYVISGKAKFKVGEEQSDVKKGSILYVKANASHQFFDIEEDLEVLVFFSTKEVKVEADDKKE